MHQHRALVHHGDDVGDLEHAVDVVLDQQHGDLLRNALHQRGDARALGRREAGERLVEQQDVRRGRKREPHVEQALPAIGERGGLGALHAFEPEIRHERRRLGIDCGDAVGRGPPGEALGVPRLHGEAHVFLDRQAAEQVGDLERAADAGARDVFRLESR